MYTNPQPWRQQKTPAMGGQINKWKHMFDVFYYFMEKQQRNIDESGKNQ